MKKDTTKAEV